MLDRRSFIKTAAVAVAATACGAYAQSPRANPSGIGGGGYRLPAFAKGSRLLFQGDSITDMNWGRNQADRNHYLGHSYVFLLAARLGVDMPAAKLEFFNRGISGNTVDDLKKRWQADAIDMKPDLLSILIGTNDVGRAGKAGVRLDAWEADYRFLLDASRKANPKRRLVLLDPFVLCSGKLADKKEEWEFRRRGVEQIGVIVARLAQDYQAVHIRTQAVFDAAAKAAEPAQWIWDGIHPLPQGHELIARNWLQETNARWS
jgi:lysophospholipase L1-like esterase